MATLVQSSASITEAIPAQATVARKNLGVRVPVQQKGTYNAHAPRVLSKDQPFAPLLISAIEAEPVAALRVKHQYPACATY